MLARPLLCCLALLLATGASAQTHIRWNACFGDGGAVNRDFACNTDTGSEQLVCSFTPGVPWDSVYQVRAIVNLAFPGSSLPPWWQFRTAGSCRVASLVTSTAPPLTASACIDWADGSRDALVTYQPNVNTPSLAEFRVTTPVTGYRPFDLVAGQEYFLFTATISHEKTVGTGSCSGCTLGGCMGFVAALLIRSEPVPPHYPVQIPPVRGVGQVVTWQGGGGIAIPNYLGAGWTYCPGATPTRNSTWGDVKALYR